MCHVTHLVTTTHGDLFESIQGMFDTIVFNYPFFQARPTCPIAYAVCSEDDVLARFLLAAPSYLNPAGTLILPYSRRIGTARDVSRYAEQGGWACEQVAAACAANGNKVVYALTRSQRERSSTP